jgi:hypothetical protein
MSDFEEFARSQGFSGDFQRGCNGQYKSDLLHFMEKAFMRQQAEIDRLSSVLDERTNEWLQAIELGAYFENVAKPLKEENDRLKAQLNNMEACYIGIKKINDEQSAIIQGHFAARQDMQKRIDEYKKLTVSIRNEFDLWSDDSEFADVIEAQIENLEALRGES